MSKRPGVLALAAITLPLVVLAGTGPASAQQVDRSGKGSAGQPAPPAGRPCGANYTNGQVFSLTTSPQPSKGRNGETVVTVARNAEVQLASRLLASAPANGNPNGQRPCPGQPVDIFAASQGAPYTTVNKNRITDTTGSVYGSKRATSDFRFFSRYNVNATRIGAESATTLVQIR